jgi:enamine deaminase RidA (YjgF/YER057c/UK114 family)
MSSSLKLQMVTGARSRSASIEQRLTELGIQLPKPPEPFGTYVESVQAGNLLFLSGMLPTEGHSAKFVGRVGAELDLDAGREAAHLAALNALAVARQHLGSLDRVTRSVRLGVLVATAGDFHDHPKVADAASELLRDVFGPDKKSCRLVYGVASLPLGTPVELDVIFEVSNASLVEPEPPHNGIHFRGGGVREALDLETHVAQRPRTYSGLRKQELSVTDVRWSPLAGLFGNHI